ncbi:Sec-independent protein translocase subunit TatA [Nocardia asteroides]|uniref:Sec-independent protein translocase subunit TatA n=1 Tax=Nocardia asteroides TaxID=1824 RepID=UPI001E58F05F|nr:Sec-independent protein translocase subunit TatA [Nocardia asteroides]UGT62944.1 Sec-independent protein translocase subunit TatA [Nocardia asteroides]
MGSLSIWHWLIIAALFVMFFGAKRLPDAARGLGRSLRIFKSEVSQMQNESGNQQPAPQQPAAEPTQQLPAAAPQPAPVTEPTTQSKSL